MTATESDARADDAGAVLVVVRHGQSEWNALRRWQGTADPPLTPLGEAQAVAQADWLAELDDNWVGLWSSPLQRAAATAEVIGRRLELSPLQLDERLREAYAGEWEGFTPAEIDDAWPGYLARNQRPPSFEPDPVVRERAWAALSDIADAVAERGSALVVAHSGLMRRVSELHGFGEVAVPNLGGYRLSLRRNAGAWVVDELIVFEPLIAAPPRPGGIHTD